MQGNLYLVATPIGNLEDITLRALRILKEADLIAAEDTRNSIKLLNHFEIKTPMTSYHEYNKVDKARTIVDKIKQGENVALITDAGTPAISDPGEELVRQCLDSGIAVIPIPGAVACINALIMSGRATRRFCFEAFLPSDKKERQAVLDELVNETRTIILYEAPHHLVAVLRELIQVLGGDRKLSVCRELTKRHESMQRFTLDEALEWYTQNEPRGEFVLVISGKDRGELVKDRQKQWEVMTVAEHVLMYEKQGIEHKEAMKLAAKDRGISRRDVYQELLNTGQP